MHSTSYAPILERIRAAIEASRAVFARFTPGAINTEYKAGQDPVTEADRALDAVLRKELLRDDEGWLSEESVDDPIRLQRSRVWVVDPLDGTREFIKGIPEFCVSIGFVENGRPVAGGIYNPATDETFLGSIDSGVIYNGKPAQPSQRKTLDGALVLASRSEVNRGEWKPFENAAFKIRPVGSVAYKLALVSAGLADVTFTLSPKNEWDVVAGAALVNSAGGFVSTLEKTELTANRRDPLLSGLLASGPFLKDQLLALVESQIHAAEEAMGNPAIEVSGTQTLSAAERHKVLVEWNDTRVDYPTDVPLHRFIEEQVKKSPESVAVIYESEQLTYRELNRRANRLAHRLEKLKVGPDVLVAVCMERSLDLVVSLLAILKAGGAYVPLDPEYPRERLETMLRDANPPAVLANSHLADRLPENFQSLICLDRDWPSLASESPENLTVAVNGKNLAYAIYTSGSTGKPKGVANVHEGIVNRLLWMQDMYKLTEQDRVLQKTPFSFDVSVWEFFWPLMTGSTLVMARPGGHRDPAYLVNLIAEQGITTLHFVPSMLSIFLEASGLERCDTLRRVFASGEALPFPLQQRFFEKLGAELHNLYGPTEAAVDVTYWPCRRDSELRIVPIGRPIANTEIYVLDAQLEPVPVGATGELHIGGIGLARGYLNQPELTAQKFIPDPFSKVPGARLYKTGDSARFLPDGNIEYLGRMDNQVKLRGFRIELGEIEAVLGTCTGIRQAAVILREDTSGDKSLVAYLIAVSGQQIDVKQVTTEIRAKLPEHMVPSRFVPMEAFPMTTSGKVDRNALPPPRDERVTSVTLVAPRNELESAIAAAFARVLGLPAVGVTDDFFELGGQSLSAARLLTQVKQISGREIPLSALFRGATVESLAQLITQSQDTSDPVLMEIQRGESSSIPFFAIVPPGEESLGYAMLARHMGSEQKVYKVQGHAPVLKGKRPYSRQEMQSLTEEYIAAIRSAQPHGPYCLGGLCEGTHIGEQIVLGLEAQGEEVGLFAIFDTWVLEHSQIRWLWKIHYYGRRLREMKTPTLSARFASYQRIARNKVDHVLGKSAPRRDWSQVYWPENFTPAQFLAPVILFKRPKQQFYYVKDPQMGWGARTRSGVEIWEMDFHHLEILREPHVRRFGEILKEAMARISQRNLRPQTKTEDPQASRFTAHMQQGS